MREFIFELVDPADLNDLREKQISDLKGSAQESTEEAIVTYNADFVRISKGEETIGYACLGTSGSYNNTVLEYYVIESCRTSAGDILRQLVRDFCCAEWLVNTQDFFAFPLMIDMRLVYRIDAYKFTVDHSIDADYELTDDMTLEITTAAELDAVYRLVTQDGFYTGGGIETLSRIISAEELYSLRKNEKLIGAGFVSVLKRTPVYADIAMIIDENERHNGWGYLLVKALINRCRQLGFQPTAVCDVNNTASRKTLQKAGFYLDGCLLEARLAFQSGLSTGE